MEKEIRQCQNCKTQFTIEEEDFQFYEKIKVPPPTFCPRCRIIRRLMWRDERTLYKSVCKKCGKETLSTYHKDSPYNVYCRDCYYSDAWDGMDYGRDYDFSKPFFQQFRELLEAVPRPAMTLTNSVNCDYSQATMYSKNCYFVFGAFHAEDSMYSAAPIFSKKVVDSYLPMNADQGYELVHVDGGYRLRFAYYSDQCLESSFIYDCRACSDCFGCVNLRSKQYCLFNRQLSKKEYREEMAKWDLGSFKILEQAKKKFAELLASIPHRYAFITNSINVTGNIIQNSKNSRTVFSALNGVENCKYIYFGGLNLKDSYDVHAGGDTSELLYESGSETKCQSNFFSARNGDSRNLRYSEFMGNCSDCFGCAGLKHKKYCILNKQYTKESFDKLRMEIIKHMNDKPFIDSKGRVFKYGEFFPPEISVYSYNETPAQNWFPLTKDEALAKGYAWRDPEARHYVITIKPGNLPDHINDVKDDIINEVIGCAHFIPRDSASGQRESAGGCGHQCITAFRITKAELEFYRAMNLALPRLCPNCRHYERRASFVFPMELYERNCSCRGQTGNGRDVLYKNTSVHFHGEKHCPNEFQTAYTPDRREIVYCEACYKSEFL